MAYIDYNKLTQYIDEKELINLTDDENIGMVEQSKIDEAINSATNEINSYLQDKYTIPLSPPPKLIIDICADITIYNLYKRRMRLNMPESIINIYNDAIDKLEKIRKGMIVLNISQTESSGFIKINKTENDRIFNKDLLDSL